MLDFWDLPPRSHTFNCGRPPSTAWRRSTTVDGSNVHATARYGTLRPQWEFYFSDFPFPTFSVDFVIFLVACKEYCYLRLELSGEDIVVVDPASDNKPCNTIFLRCPRLAKSVTFRSGVRLSVCPIFLTSVRRAASFLPRDAMLARYMLSLCVHPSARLSHTCIVLKRLKLNFSMACEFPVAVKAKLMLTAIHCLLYFTFCIKTALFPVGCRPLCNMRFFGLTRVFIPNGISISSAVFAQLTVECPYNLQWAATFLPQNCPFVSGIGASV